MYDQDKLKEFKREYEEYLEKIRKESGNDRVVPPMEVFKEFADKLRQIRIDTSEEDEVLGMIQKIRNKYCDYKLGRTASDFLEGGCYYFAYMLKEIYKEKASIYISLSDEIHAIVKIGDKFYDVNGVFGDEERIKKYHDADNDDFNYFMDICCIGRNKDNIKIFEARCDDILKEIKQEMDQEPGREPK